MKINAFIILMLTNSKHKINGFHQATYLLDHGQITVLRVDWSGKSYTAYAAVIKLFQNRIYIKYNIMVNCIFIEWNHMVHFCRLIFIIFV